MPLLTKIPMSFSFNPSNFPSASSYPKCVVILVSKMCHCSLLCLLPCLFNQLLGNWCTKTSPLALVLVCLNCGDLTFFVASRWLGCLSFTLVRFSAIQTFMRIYGSSCGRKHHPIASQGRGNCFNIINFSWLRRSCPMLRYLPHSAPVLSRTYWGSWSLVVMWQQSTRVLVRRMVYRNSLASGGRERNADLSPSGLRFHLLRALGTCFSPGKPGKLILGQDYTVLYMIPLFEFPTVCLKRYEDFADTSVW